MLDLLRGLQEQFHLAYLFISHDLQVVRHVADRVAVMYLGMIVEPGPTEACSPSPASLYPRAAVGRAGRALGSEAQRTRLTGEITSPIDPPDACRLVGRCPLERPACSVGKPPLIDIGDGRSVACPVVVEWIPSLVKGRK